MAVCVFRVLGSGGVICAALPPFSRISVSEYYESTLKVCNSLSVCVCARMQCAFCYALVCVFFACDQVVMGACVRGY